MGMLTTLAQIKCMHGGTVTIVGILGLVLSMIFWSSWAGPGYFTRRRTTYVDDGPPAAY